MLVPDYGSGRTLLPLTGSDEQSNTEMGIAFDAILAPEGGGGCRHRSGLGPRWPRGQGSRPRRIRPHGHPRRTSLLRLSGGSDSPVRTFSATGRDVDVDTISFQYDKETGNLVLVDDKDAKEQSTTRGRRLRPEVPRRRPRRLQEPDRQGAMNGLDGCSETTGQERYRPGREARLRHHREGRRFEDGRGEAPTHRRRHHRAPQQPDCQRRRRLTQARPDQLTLS